MISIAFFCSVGVRIVMIAVAVGTSYYVYFFLVVLGLSECYP